MYPKNICKEPDGAFTWRGPTLAIACFCNGPGVKAQAVASDSKVESFYPWSADFRHFICTSGEETAVSRDFPLSLAVIRSSSRRIHHQCSQQNSQQALGKATRVTLMYGGRKIYQYKILEVGKPGRRRSWPVGTVVIVVVMTFPWGGLLLEPCCAPWWSIVGSFD